MSNNRTKIYTRIDAQGNKIPGSSVQRKSMPRTGKWVEETVNLCCSPYTELLATTDGAFDTTTIALTILCDAVDALVIVTPELTTTTIAELVDYLNANYSYLGLFSEDATGVTLKLNQEIGASICADLGDLTFTIGATV